MDGIMDIPLPITWKTLNIERYDDISNPDEYLDAFTTQANLYSNDDVVLCKVFPTSLKGPGLTWWYKRLPLRSTNSFITLAQHFGAQYVTSHPHHRTPVALVNLHQSNNESMQVFMERYVAISIKIRNINLGVGLHSMITALTTSIKRSLET